MVEITTKLSNERSVYLAGETIECLITFKNNYKKEQINSVRPKFAKLAWASAQIHCQCSINENRINLDNTEAATMNNTSNNGTSFIPLKGEKGATIYATKPRILFCDIVIYPGEEQTFIYHETLSTDIPPSYRGIALKYSYKLTIGAQRIGCQIKLLRIPFRVLVVPGLEDISVYESSENDNLRPSNPFYENSRRDNSLLEVAMENLQSITCRKSPSYFNVSNKIGRVASICVFKQAFRIGDEVLVLLDFEQSQCTCVQFRILLQSEEQISENCQKRALSPTSNPSGSKNSSASGLSVTTFSRHEEFTINMLKTHVSLPIPLTASPSFTTDLVSLKWKLKFEFVTLKDESTRITVNNKSDKMVDKIWHAPDWLDVETTMWDLPIKVFATNPNFATRVFMLPTSTTCIF